MFPVGGRGLVIYGVLINNLLHVVTLQFVRMNKHVIDTISFSSVAHYRHSQTGNVLVRFFAVSIRLRYLVQLSNAPHE